MEASWGTHYWLLNIYRNFWEAHWSVVSPSLGLNSPRGQQASLFKERIMMNLYALRFFTSSVNIYQSIRATHPRTPLWQHEPLLYSRLRIYAKLVTMKRNLNDKGTNVLDRKALKRRHFTWYFEVRWLLNLQQLILSEALRFAHGVFVPSVWFWL